MSGFERLRGLLSDTVEAAFPGITTEHGKAKADAVIAEFSEREELLAEVYKKGHYDLLNMAYSPGGVQKFGIDRELKTGKDLDAFLNDPDEQRKVIEYNLEHIFTDEAYDDITADEVLEFADTLDHRVKNRVLYPDREESTQELDTLA